MDEGYSPSSVFVDNELVQAQLTSAAKFVTERAGEIFKAECEASLIYVPTLAFESPLEVAFWVWWQALLRTSRIGDILKLRPQVDVALEGQRFRVDFLVAPLDSEVAASPGWRPIAVELDGHEFHERTRDQVASRDSRDRTLQAAGWRVFHYSFSEFIQRPRDAVAEVMVFARGQWNEVATALWKAPTASS